MSSAVLHDGSVLLALCLPARRKATGALRIVHEKYSKNAGLMDMAKARACVASSACMHAAAGCACVCSPSPGWSTQALGRCAGAALRVVRAPGLMR